MAALAMVAVACAAICAAVAAGGLRLGGVAVPVPVYATALVATTAVAAARMGRRRIDPSTAGKVVAGVTGVGAAVLYLAGPRTLADNLEGIGALMALAVVPVSVLWPEPTLLRYSLLLGVGSVLGGQATLAESGGPLAGLAAASAVALVAAGRLATATAPRLEPTGAGRAMPPPSTGFRLPEWGRMAGEAGIVLAVVALVAVLAGAVIPPPSTGQATGGDAPLAGRPGAGRGGRAEPSPLVLGEELDVTVAQDGPERRVVLRVAAPGPSVWRAQTLDRWDGRAWRRTPDTASTIQDRRAFVQGIGDSPDGEAFDQRITIEASSADVLVAAPSPTRVVVPSGQVRTGLDGSLRPLPSLGTDAVYLVQSRRQAASEAGLRARDPSGSEVPALLGQLYLQLPVVSARVRSLAARVGAAAPTAYDKALALEGWLRVNTEVASQVPALPEGPDAVDAFVFGDDPGSPQRSATAMAVMLRSLAIPARLAVGFLPGRRSLLSGDFVVRASDSHAWVEAWFPEGGWQRFDPSGRIATAEQEDSLLSRLSRLLRQLWVPLAAALILVGCWLIWRRLRQLRRRAVEPWVSRFFVRLAREGARRGRPRQPQETPAEYASALAASVLPDQRLEDVGELVSAAAYSGREPPPEARRWAEQVLSDAKAMGGRPARQRRRAWR